ncbi:hypothetical protein HED49_06910 [Ochrobactrum daejeonense]|nr:hypothetical protein [Brucella daejeonensis]
MSSIALNSRNITMISRLLREARKPGDTQDLRTDAARYLARRFQEGTRDEGRLQIALTQFIKNIEEWQMPSIVAMTKATQ